ncbi:hypothetical protein QFZ79_002731 [Arthrobacter sp. V4I6]|uniref:hypothetical protein n=1 Tax=unclassified Arthrobacter TaxID=235627 RepID=UPI002786F411|nr:MULTISPECIES: hypothetical protein [unclassified Arthrobacter]MDQ0820439.1 hypothetical protein [Arthrobacter sp. V1I7]MDQ0854620.1 hypothetical protein [Arthrobacter sp. V4I6]
MLLTSILRTLVPALWGSLVAWLLGVAPLLAPLEAHLLGVADIILPILTAVIIGAWYAFWRWLEPRLPDWFTRAVLGSAQTPTYQGKHEDGSQVPNVNTEQHLTADTRERLRE